MSNPVTIDQANDVATAHFAGPEISHETMQEAVLTLAERIRYDGARHFILDLSDVNFLASACLGALVSLLQETEAVRGRIVLVGCASDVRFLLKVTQLDSVFRIFDDQDDANAALLAA